MSPESCIVTIHALCNDKEVLHASVDGLQLRYITSPESKSVFSSWNLQPYARTRVSAGKRLALMAVAMLSLSLVSIHLKVALLPDSQPRINRNVPQLHLHCLETLPLTHRWECFKQGRMAGQFWMSHVTVHTNGPIMARRLGPLELHAVMTEPPNQQSLRIHRCASLFVESRNSALADACCGVSKNVQSQNCR